MGYRCSKKEVAGDKEKSINAAGLGGGSGSPYHSSDPLEYLQKQLTSGFLHLLLITGTKLFHFLWVSSKLLNVKLPILSEAQKSIIFCWKGCGEDLITLTA